MSARLRAAAAFALAVLAGACAPAADRRREDCERTFTMAKATGQESRPRLEKLMMESGGVPTPFLLYQACRAIVSGDESPCDALPPVEMADGKKYPRICRQDVNEVAIAKAFITRAPDAEALCEKATGDGEGLVPPGKVRELCAAVVSHLDDPEKAAEASASFAVNGSTAAAAELSRGARRLLGDPKACDETVEPEEKHNCGQFAAFRAARKAGTPSACAGMVYCRLMAGAGPEACEAEAARARALWCAP